MTDGRQEGVDMEEMGEAGRECFFCEFHLASSTLTQHNHIDIKRWHGGIWTSTWAMYYSLRP